MIEVGFDRSVIGLVVAAQEIGLNDEARESGMRREYFGEVSSRPGVQVQPLLRLGRLGEDPCSGSIHLRGPEAVSRRESGQNPLEQLRQSQDLLCFDRRPGCWPHVASQRLPIRADLVNGVASLRVVRQPRI